MGPAQHPRQLALPGLHLHLHGRGAIPEIPRAARGVGGAEYAGEIVEGEGVSGGGGFLLLLFFFGLSEVSGFITGGDLRIDGGHVGVVGYRYAMEQ